MAPIGYAAGDGKSTGRTRTVPAVVPSVRQSQPDVPDFGWVPESSPLKKKTVPPTSVMKYGRTFELVPGSKTGTVPAAVPSDFHRTKLLAPSAAEKYRRSPTTAIPY